MDISCPPNLSNPCSFIEPLLIPSLPLSTSALSCLLRALFCFDDWPLFSVRWTWRALFLSLFVSFLDMYMQYPPPPCALASHYSYRVDSSLLVCVWNLSLYLGIVVGVLDPEQHTTRTMPQVIRKSSEHTRVNKSWSSFLTLWPTLTLGSQTDMYECAWLMWSWSNVWLCKFALSLVSVHSLDFSLFFRAPLFVHTFCLPLIHPLCLCVLLYLTLRQSLSPFSLIICYPRDQPPCRSFSCQCFVRSIAQRLISGCHTHYLLPLLYHVGW